MAFITLKNLEARGRIELPHKGFADLSLTTWVPRREGWSGKRDSNPRLRPWQGRTLPLSYSRLKPESSTYQKIIESGRALCQASEYRFCTFTGFFPGMIMRSRSAIPGRSITSGQPCRGEPYLAPQIPNQDGGCRFSEMPARRFRQAISGGQPTRKGTRTLPIPRLT